MMSNKEVYRSPGRGTESVGEQKGDTPVERLSRDRVFDLLQNDRRRSALTYLLHNDGEATVSELVDHVAKDVCGVGPNEMSADQRKRIYTGLYQLHLDRLDEYDVIEFDRSSNHVRTSTNISVVQPYLPTHDERRATGIEIAIAVLISGIVSLGVLGIWPLATVPLPVWALITIVTLVGLAIYHLAVRRSFSP